MLNLRDSSGRLHWWLDPLSALGCIMMLVMIAASLMMMQITRQNALRLATQTYERSATEQVAILDSDQLKTLIDSYSTAGEDLQQVATTLETIRHEIQADRGAYLLIENEDQPGSYSLLAAHDMVFTRDPDTQVLQLADDYLNQNVQRYEGILSTISADHSTVHWDRSENGFMSALIPLTIDQHRLIAVLESSGQAQTAAMQIFLAPMHIVVLLAVCIVLVALLVFVSIQRRYRRMHDLSNERAHMMKQTSHQLGGPISTLRWWLELLHDEVASQPGESQKQEMVLQLEQATMRLTDIMDRLREAHDIEVGNVTQNVAVLPIKEIIEVAIDQTSALLTERKQTLEKNVNREATIEVDPDLLTRVLAELLDNASHFSPENTTITISAWEHKESLMISVSDQGIGIPKKERRNIFQKFYRCPKADRYKPNGDGLGLYTSQQIITAMHGKLVCQANKNKGVTFTITLPLQID